MIKTGCAASAQSTSIVVNALVSLRYHIDLSMCLNGAHGAYDAKGYEAYRLFQFSTAKMFARKISRSNSGDEESNIFTQKPFVKSIGVNIKISSIIRKQARNLVPRWGPDLKNTKHETKG